MSQILGKYKVLKELGRGSSGVVYLVEHGDLNVKYAFKVLNNATSSDPRLIEQFKREAEVLLKFTHEGCIQLRDFGRLDSGHYYMATDYCEGGTLKEWIAQKGRLDPVFALQLLHQLLLVLSAAHDRGIIHRDIKAENIMIERDHKGRLVVKVLDFGIAKLLEMELSFEGGTGTDRGSIGTPAYMAPEQAYGDVNIDHRVDIYAAGIVGYEMLNGGPPYQGTNVVQTLIAHITQQPEPFAGNLGIPVSVEELIFKALEKNRDHRYGNAQAFADAVKRALTDISGGEGEVRSNVATNGSASGSHAPLAGGGRSAAPSQEKTKILVLDDEAMLLTLMKHILEKEGFEVFTAPDCSAIHPYLFEHDVKLLIADVCMPDIPGWKICRMLKDSLPNLKIILFSNLPEDELQRLHSESKSDAWLSKAAKPNHWIPVIRKVLEAR